MVDGEGIDVRGRLQAARDAVSAARVELADCRGMCQDDVSAIVAVDDLLLTAQGSLTRIRDRYR